MLPVSSPDPSARLHDGFYLRMALGAGFIHDSIDIEGFERPETLSGFGALLEFHLGGTPAPGFVIGGALVLARLGNARREVGGRPVEPEPGDPARLDVAVSALVAFLDYYLDPREGLHGQALLGLAGGNLTDRDGREAYGDDAQGPVLGLGVGYDLWVSDQWSLGLLGRVTYHSLAADVEPAETNAVLVFGVLATATLH